MPEASPRAAPLDHASSHLRGAVYILTARVADLEWQLQQRQSPQPQQPAPSLLLPINTVDELGALLRARFTSQATSHAGELSAVTTSCDALAERLAVSTALAGALQDELCEARRGQAGADAVALAAARDSGVARERAGVESARLRGSLALAEAETARVLERLASAQADLAERLSQLTAAGEGCAVACASSAESAAARGRAEAAAACAREESLRLRQRIDASCEGFAVERASRAAALARAEASEMEAVIAQSSAAAALASHKAALSALASERSRADSLACEVAALRGGLDAAGAAQMEATASAAAASEREAIATEELGSCCAMRDAALSRASAAESAAAAAACRVEALTLQAQAATESEGTTRAAFHKALDGAAEARGIVAALEAAAAESDRRCEAARAACSLERSARMEAQAEVATLRDKISRKPELEVLNKLELGALLDKNSEAALAVKALLARHGGEKEM